MWLIMARRSNFLITPLVTHQYCLVKWYAEPNFAGKYTRDDDMAKRCIDLPLDLAGVVPQERWE
jgi:hypothetical protein